MPRSVSLFFSLFVLLDRHQIVAIHFRFPSHYKQAAFLTVAGLGQAPGQIIGSLVYWSAVLQPGSRQRTPSFCPRSSSSRDQARPPDDSSTHWFAVITAQQLAEKTLLSPRKKRQKTAIRSQHNV